MRKLLSFILLLSGIMPLMVGISGLASYTNVLEMFKITGGEGSFELVTIIAACMVPLGVIQFVACYWTWKNDWHGVVLARIIGCMLLFDGITLTTVLHRADLGGMDMAKGGVILVLAMLIKSPSKSPLKGRLKEEQI